MAVLVGSQSTAQQQTVPNSGGQVWWGEYTASASGNVATLHISAEQASASAVILAIYNSDRDLIGATSAITLPGSIAESSAAITPVAVTASQTYYLAAIPTTAGYISSHSSGSWSSRVATGSGVAPDPLPAGTEAAYGLPSIWAEDAPASGPQGEITIDDVTPGITTVDVEFSYDDTDEDGYEYRVDGGSPVDIETSTSFQVTGLDPATEYGATYIQVRAYNEDGESDWVNVGVFETLPVPGAVHPFTSVNIGG